MHMEDISYFHVDGIPMEATMFLYNEVEILST